MATCKNFHMELEDAEVCCPLCLDIFEIPKSFPNCAHNICKSCLSRLISKKADADVECPVCRQTSPLPSRGADGFPTNTFIVRLIEKIPGVKEKGEINRAVRLCKSELERNKKVRETMEKQLGTININKQLGEELKIQISSRAKECIKIIVNHENMLHKEVDDYLNEHCGLQLHKQLEKDVEKMTDYLQDAQSCIFNVEETVDRDDLTEICTMKEVIEAQLKEYSQYPEPFVLKSALSLKSFDLSFEKSDMHKDLLGKVTASDKAIHLVRSSEAHEDPFEESLSGGNSSSMSDDTPTVIYSDEYVELDTEGVVLHSVDLPFSPTRMAVCPESGDVALLCKENRKVFLYSANADYRATIQIAYGTLSDVGFCSSLGEVVVVNSESNRLLFYDYDGTFQRRKYNAPSGNLKFTYLSCHNDVLTVVSSKMADECEHDYPITKCIVVYKSNYPTPTKVFGYNELVNPLSRAIYYNGKIYVADSRECLYGYEVVLKVFSEPEFELIQLVVSNSTITNSAPTDFVSVFSDNHCKLFGTYPESPLLVFACPNENRVCVIDGSSNMVGGRFINQAVKQQELIDPNAVRSFINVPDNDVLQVEISSGKSFQVVLYHHVTQ